MKSKRKYHHSVGMYRGVEEGEGQVEMEGDNFQRDRRAIFSNANIKKASVCIDWL